MAALFGEALLAQDRLVRNTGLHRIGRRLYAELDDLSHEMLEP